MNLGLAIILIIIALVGGFAGGFFMSRKYMMNYFEENPPIDANMIRTMMLSMGQKPSERKVQQILNQMKKAPAKRK